VTLVDQGRARARPWSRLVRDRTSLDVYMTVVCLLGLPAAVWSVLRLTDAPLRLPVQTLVALVVVLVIGELLPIDISRRGRVHDQITISTTFALALVLIAPLGVVVLAQAVPLVYDDLRRGKHWTRPVFNTAQYTLTFFAARATYCTIAGKDFLDPTALRSDDLAGAFAAGLAFFAVNHACVSIAIALFSGERVGAQMVEDFRFQVSTSGLLVLLAPLVVVSATFSLVLVPVLLLPIAAVRLSAQLATQREHDALHDGLTGLPNRALLTVEMDRLLEDAARSGHGAAVVLADLDHFKEINDTLGHAVGDLLIAEVAARLTRAAGEDVVVARLGGDEFALLANTVDDRDAVALAERLIAGLREPFALAGVRLDVQASLGIALFPEHGDDGAQLLTRADVAMYLAKEERGSWRLYDHEDDIHTPQRLALLAELRDGIDRDELVLHFQPKCATRSGEVVGVEALVRWQHPQRGLLMPDTFIPVAEGTALIGLLTMVVLETAVAQVRAWLDGGRRLGMAVNLSVRHLTDLGLPAQVAAVLDRHDVPAGLLTLEVTESTIMNNPSRAISVLSGLRALGVRIAVDDYGTGYSSLAYLKRLAVDELKIDKSFVLGMRTDENDAVIVRSTVELGHNLGLRLVAEGVEDIETWQQLLPLGCDVVQGYHISRPLTADAFLPWLATWEAAVAAGLAAPSLPSLDLTRGKDVPDRRPAPVRPPC
jgi:diguanylate cyclase (GGDEF)-like protein